MNLYEINQELQSLISQGVDEDGVIIEGYEDKIDSISMAKDEKLLNCAKYIKNETAFVDMLKSEEKALSARRKAIESRIAWMKKYVLSNVSEGEKVQDSQATISTRKSKAVKVDESLITADYCNIVTTQTPDKKAIKKAIESGIPVLGAKIVENISLQVK